MTYYNKVNERENREREMYLITYTDTLHRTYDLHSHIEEVREYLKSYTHTEVIVYNLHQHTEYIVYKLNYRTLTLSGHCIELTLTHSESRKYCI